MKHFYHTIIFLLCASFTQAEITLSDIAQKHLLMPPPPNVSSEAYILLDAQTGTVIAQKNADKKMRPASLTKLMTSYVIFNGIRQGHLSEDDEVRISTNAWKTEGSRMFLAEHSKLDLKSLVKGTIIVSANDASVALSEHYAGSESNFAMIMNRVAKEFGMKNSSFMTATGLDDDNHYSSARDIATLSSHIVEEFPQYFHWFSEGSLSHASIKQNNRNTLIQSHPEVDGLKTGFTNAAGHCLASTAKKGNTRLILVTLNAPSSQIRDRDTMSLLNYGFRFYETILVYPANTTITDTKVYQGQLKTTALENHKPFWITAPRGTKDKLSIDTNIQTIVAPISNQTQAGEVVAKIDDIEITKAPLYVKHPIQQSNGLRRYIDKIKLLFIL